MQAILEEDPFLLPVEPRQDPTGPMSFLFSMISAEDLNASFLKAHFPLLEIPEIPTEVIDTCLANLDWPLSPNILSPPNVGKVTVDLGCCKLFS